MSESMESFLSSMFGGLIGYCITYNIIRFVQKRRHEKAAKRMWDTTQ